MGLTHVDVKVLGPTRRKSATVSLLVDSGAAFSVIAGDLLKRIGVKPDATQRFELANGETVERKTGSAWFEIAGRRGAGPVVFGEPGDADLLGIVTLECLGLAFDPLRRELKPLRLLLVRLVPE
jgi:predicted aspartyl protease